MNIHTIETLIGQYVHEYRDHKLHAVHTDPDARLRGWYVRPPDGGRMGSFLVLAHPEGVSIHGDCAPGDTSGSCVGASKSLAWFIGELGVDYLASKFLPKVWCPERALMHVEDAISELEREAAEEEDGDAADVYRARASDLRGALGRYEVGQEYEYHEHFAPLIWEAGTSAAEDVYPRYDYDHTDAARLAAIQRTFARLWHESSEAAR